MTLTVRSASVTGATTAYRALTHAEMDANWAHVISSANQSFVQSGTGAVSRKSVHIHGPGGWGRREDTGASRAYVLWNGAAGVPMVKVQDVAGFRLSDIRFVGKSTAKPSAALNFNETNDGFANTSLLFENVWIGAGLDTADDAEQFTAGVLIDGDLNGSNSEIIGKNLKVYKCQYGIYIGRTQNVNIRLDGYYPQGCSSAAVYNAGQIQISNFSSSGNAVDFYSPATDDGGASVLSRTTVYGYLSETAGRMAEIVGSGVLLIPGGGSFSISSSLNADGKVIKAEGNTNVHVAIHDLWFLQASSPSASPYMSLGGSSTGYRHIVLDTVHGWSTRMTGGTNGLSITTGGVTDRFYIEFSEDPQTTGFFPIQSARNFNQGLSLRDWDIKRYDIWNFTSLRLFDDFLGDVLADEWNSQKGTDGACALAAITAAQNGVVRIVTGAGAGADYATNGVQMDSQLNWDAAAGSLVFECRLKLSAITNVAVYLGFTDQVSALEMPFTLTGTTYTSNATDAVGVLFDTNATTDTWRFVGVHGDTDATQQDTSLAPVAGTVR
jgi:hypothetical protein